MIWKIVIDYPKQSYGGSSRTYFTIESKGYGKEY